MASSDLEKIHSGLTFRWRLPHYRPLRFGRHSLSRLRRKLKKKQEAAQSEQRFSHSPPGHTCGLPCCSEDLPIQVRLSAPTARYGGSSAPSTEHHQQQDQQQQQQRQQGGADSNFSFRRSQLVSGRPTLTDKFLSLQTVRNGRSRGGFPWFQDDSALSTNNNGEEVGGGTRRAAKEGGPANDAATARQNLRRYVASIESDTDGSVVGDWGAGSEQPGSSASSPPRLRHPVRHLKPWECFLNREITLPDLPSTPRKMVFIDRRPIEGLDENPSGRRGGAQRLMGHAISEEEEEENQETGSGSLLTTKAAFSTLPHSHISASNSSLPFSSPAFSSSVPATLISITAATITTTTTMATDSAISTLASHPRVPYTGGVRSIPSSAIRAPLKSALKKAKPEPAKTQGDFSEIQLDVCPACAKRVQMDTEKKQESRQGGGNKVDLNRVPGSALRVIPPERELARSQASAGGGALHQGDPRAQGQDEASPRGSQQATGTREGTAGWEAGRLQPEVLQDRDDLTGHLYDLLSEVVPLRNQELLRRQTTLPSPGPSLGPLPVLRDTSSPLPEPPPQAGVGRKAFTPEPKRRLAPDSHPGYGALAEERYSTFPTRSRPLPEVTRLTIEDLAEQIYLANRAAAAARARRRRHLDVASSDVSREDSSQETLRGSSGVDGCVEDDVMSGIGSTIDDTVDVSEGGSLLLPSAIDEVFSSTSVCPTPLRDGCSEGREEGRTASIWKSANEKKSTVGGGGSNPNLYPLSPDHYHHHLLLHRSLGDVFNLFMLQEARQRLLAQAAEKREAIDHLGNQDDLRWVPVEDAESLSSLESARLSHLSLGSCQCTCLTGQNPQEEEEEGIEEKEKEEEGEEAVTLSHNPITLIL